MGNWAATVSSCYARRGDRLSKQNRRAQHEVGVYRLQGALFARKAPGNGAEAEASFHRAIEFAQQQWAESFELRAATSLARLWRGQGKTTETRELLTPVYNRLTEGFATAGLKAAKMWLDALR